MNVGSVMKGCMVLADWFDGDLKHLKKVELGYFRHFGIAMYLNSIVLLAGLLGTIHAFFPWIFAETPARLVKKAHNIIEENFNFD